MSLTLEQKRELGEFAQRLLESPPFKKVMEDLMADYLAQLLATQAGDLTVPTLHARMLALSDIQSKLKTYITDVQFSERKQR